ncbi:MAG: hypothetical protein QOI89_4013, partial [Solirubrobacteraceae bacterium]|nr:hypothetical protein [Solirubrobacteraceae bacterium]
IYENELLTHKHAERQALFERLLPAHQGQTLAGDPATPALYRLVGALKREGHDVEQVVRDAIAQRELDSADSIAVVLHYRITEKVGPPPPKDITFTRTRYIDEVPAGDTAEHDYLRRLAEVMDQRVDELGVRQIHHPEPWALRYLGDIPDDPLQRLTWSDRAGRVAAYREQYAVTSADDAIGEAPGRSAVEQRAAWEESYVALGRPAAHEDVARLSDGELLLAIDLYRRIQLGMPPDVSDRLATTSALAREYETHAALDRARGEIDTAEREERIAARLSQRAEILEEIHSVRHRAEADTTEQRHKANIAHLEYTRRHPTAKIEEKQADHTQHRRVITTKDALHRARQVTRDLDAQRHLQQDQEQQRAEEHQHHRQHDLNTEHGYSL